MLASCLVEKVLKCNHAEPSLEQNPVATNQAVTRSQQKIPSDVGLSAREGDRILAAAAAGRTAAPRRSVRAASEHSKYFA